ncbi:MAG TPA: HEAT repeat domain-containing protein [Pyrinomonadaceae bacterium]|nr:HEAT repeat domain-containing protein [Pyrinomonadaceae bacterium]
MVGASEQLRNESTAEDVPRLLELLRHHDFVVRGAAAWPLAVIGGPKYLPHLIEAHQMGFHEGHDNDGLTTALVELVELHKEEARRKLSELLGSPTPLYQRNVAWLSAFC